MGHEIVRLARPEDAAAVADVLLRARKAAAIPPGVHSDDDVRGWVRAVLLPSTELWVVDADEAVVAMMALDGDWVEQLYVAPEVQGRGLGSRLLKIAQDARRSLLLWTFESNTRAQRFYENHGFVRGEVSSDNEENAPAICFRWTAPEV
jgi:GNAT superfamily N-acetyltransferase